MTHSTPTHSTPTHSTAPHSTAPHSAAQMATGHGLRPKGARIVKTDGDDKTVSSLNQNDIEDVYLGEATLKIGDKEYTGGEGLKKALAQVDTEETEKRMKEKLTNYLKKDNFNPDTANEYHSALRFMANLNEHDVGADEAFLNEKLPVMPAEFRKPLVGGDGKIVMPGVNKLYSSLIEEKRNLEEGKENEEPEEMLKGYRKQLMQAYSALVGGGDRPLGDYSATSIADQIASPKRLAGEQTIGEEDTDAKGPKGGFAQKKVLKKKQDLSGRSTIIPSGLKRFEPTDGLDIDEVGLPEEMAWTMYEPFVRNRMAKEVGPAKAKKEHEERTKYARQKLEEEMKERPVLLNRAPSWWPYNVMAHKPTLIEEKTGDDSEKAIRIPNMVVNPFYGGDFDGSPHTAHSDFFDYGEPVTGVTSAGDAGILIKPRGAERILHRGPRASRRLAP